MGSKSSKSSKSEAPPVQQVLQVQPTAPSSPPSPAAALAQLESLFPGWDTVALEDVLASCGGEVEKATELIFQWADEASGGAGNGGDAAAAAPAAETDAAVEPCPQCITPRDTYDAVLVRNPSTYCI
jgi:hypothetical protein